MLVPQRTSKEDRRLLLVRCVSIVYHMDPSSRGRSPKVPKRKGFQFKTTSCRYTTPVQSPLISFVIISKAQRLFELNVFTKRKRRVGSVTLGIQDLLPSKYLMSSFFFFISLLGVWDRLVCLKWEGSMQRRDRWHRSLLPVGSSWDRCLLLFTYFGFFHIPWQGLVEMKDVWDGRGVYC